ncbi:MAG: PIN domain-containing protein [Candidatus Aenigmarchaeota archaeon]|nr:PIN domain-containing protein [Candidatus Aenigmarchaeota archaeon]
MNYSADTWFFLQLVNKHSKAIAIWKEIIEDKSRLLVSTVVIAETVKRFLMKNLKKELEDLLVNLKNSEKILIAEVTTEIANDAGKYAYSYGMTVVDGIILSTALKMDYKNIISIDEHFEQAEKQKLMKRIFW